MPAVRSAGPKPIPVAAESAPLLGCAAACTTGALGNWTGWGVACAIRRPSGAKCQIKTVAPTVAFRPAARATVFDSPSQRIRNSPAQKQAQADPRVLTAYSDPTDTPTLRERRTA